MSAYAYNMLHRDIIIVSIGTATAISHINKDGQYKHCIIAPGFDKMAQTLWGNAAQLPEFNLEKKEKMLKKGIKNFTTKAMVIGIPNVGKSTLINMFANKHITKTGNSAGVTKNLRWVKIDNFELLDVPGILEPSYDDKEKAINLALIGSMKESILPTYDLCNFCLDFLKNNYRQALIDRYELNDLDLNDNSQILDFISIKRGFLLKDGKPDISKTELVLLNEFKNGLITKYTLERI